jgi:CRP-like cAMP-binding protein
MMHPETNDDWSRIRPLVARLNSYVPLNNDDVVAIARAVTSVRDLQPGMAFVKQGEQTNAVHILMSGFGCRYKSLTDGQRQITAHMVPGDMSGFGFMSMAIDHSAAALAPSSVGLMPLPNLVALCERHTRVARALLHASAVDEAIGREWLINLGHRTAIQRMAHLFCELFVRLRTVGLTEQNTYKLPITQAELGEALGLSTVHVNRTLQELRRNGQISVKAGSVTLLQPASLAATAMFNGSYLRSDTAPVATAV